MKAVVWHGRRDVRVESVPDPALVNPSDVIVRVSVSGLCAGDGHLYEGTRPMMRPGDVLGHEFVGVVEEVGPAVRTLHRGNRVVVAATIACGACEPCRRGLYSLCDNSNPNAAIMERLCGYSAGGMFGYSHLFGGYSGGQAEYVRVPFADCGALSIPPELSDEEALALSDLLPAGFQAVEAAGITPGDVVAVWGCGAVGQFAIRSAFMLGASRVIAIDRSNERIDHARESGAEAINSGDCEVLDGLHQFTGGRGPDVCIDAASIEARGLTPDGVVIHEAIRACGKGGTVSIPGLYTGFDDALPVGALFGKGLRIRTGMTNVQRYIRPLMKRIAQKDVDPRFVVTHRGSLGDAPKLYREMARSGKPFVRGVLRVNARVTSGVVEQANTVPV